MVAPRGGGATRMRAPQSSNQNWMEDCYWPKAGAVEQGSACNHVQSAFLPHSSLNEPIRSRNSLLSDDPDRLSDSENKQSYQMQVLKAQHQQHKSRNQFIVFKSRLSRTGHRNDHSSLGEKFMKKHPLMINAFDDNSINELDEAVESPVISTPTPIQATTLKIKSKIPISPKCYRKKLWNSLFHYISSKKYLLVK